MIKLSCSVTYEHSMVRSHYAAYAIPLVCILNSLLVDLPLPIVKPYSLDNIQQCPVCSDQYDDIQGLFDHLYRGHGKCN